MAKKPISATIDSSLLEWIAEECKDTTKYRNKSHLIEIALLELRKREKDNG
tara:strand:+ start:1463 stop:1615 length:153 start_codon:yes stop_codon:yes gene_type:complete